jgi:sigma-B regulation protein RsbU (phosphoserine phosphatase)
MSAITQHLDIIADMSQDFALSGDIEETLRRGLARIADAVGAEAASLFLVDAEMGELVCHGCTGPVDVAGLRIPMSSGIVGCAVANNQARMVRDARSDPAFRDSIDTATGFVTRSIICAPMSVRAERLGAIELINKRGGGFFSAGDRHLLQALASSAALALFNARLAARMMEQEGVRRELTLAAEIQRSMLPGAAVGPVRGINQPAHVVSGDFFDALALADGSVAFCIGDVSGKGINAALLMAKTASLFRCLAKTVPSPGRLLAMINDELCETGTSGHFVTMAAGVYDPAQRWVTLANAGHEPASLFRDGAFRSLPAKAPPLGILPDLIGDRVAENGFPLDGGCLYLYTDGITEGPDGRGGMLGAEGVQGMLAELAPLPPDQRLQAVLDRLADHGPPRDDLTMLLVEDLCC